MSIARHAAGALLIPSLEVTVSPPRCATTILERKTLHRSTDFFNKHTEFSARDPYGTESTARRDDCKPIALDSRSVPSVVKGKDLMQASNDQIVS